MTSIVLPAIQVCFAVIAAVLFFLLFCNKRKDGDNDMLKRVDR